MGDSYYLGKGLSSLFWPKAKIDIADVEPKQSWCISKWTWAGGWIGEAWGDSWDQLLDEIASVRKVVASFRFPGPDVSFSELRGKVILHLGPVGTVFDYAAACWTFPQSWHFFFPFSSSQPERVRQSNPAHLSNGEIQAENSSAMCPDITARESEPRKGDSLLAPWERCPVCLVKAPRKWFCSSLLKT